MLSPITWALSLPKMSLTMQFSEKCKPRLLCTSICPVIRLCVWYECQVLSRCQVKIWRIPIMWVYIKGIFVYTLYSVATQIRRRLARYALISLQLGTAKLLKCNWGGWMRVHWNYISGILILWWSKPLGEAQYTAYVQSFNKLRRLAMR